MYGAFLKRRLSTPKDCKAVAHFLGTDQQSATHPKETNVVMMTNFDKWRRRSNQREGPF
jgi:hypothetical protein